ncbi:MAG: class I SAM-dependent methyltransferase, partial [Planctomycetes bacterium]|nr:class I SAM-dependent methyltransferase [Planctomycetota bacterium]
SAAIKRDIIAKYDSEATAKDCPEWLAAGGSVRVPESRASHYFIDRKIREALALYGRSASRPSRALEIGCSFGHMTALLAARCEQLTAVDLSAASVAIAAKRLRHYGIANTSFVVDDAESLAHLADETFDVAFSFSTIRYCPAPEAALSAIRRKLRPGGIAILDFPNRYSPWHGALKGLLGLGAHVHDTLYTKRQAVRLCEQAGFRIETVKVFLFTTKRLPTVLLPLFRGVDLVCERLPLVRNLGGIIMVKGVKER